MENTDVAVVGAGPAGIAAATVAAHLDARVTLIDEQAGPGGHLRWMLARQTGPPEEIDGRRGFEVAAAEARKLAAANVRTEPGAVAWGHFDGNVLGVAGNGSSYELQAEAIILATGSTDIVWPFRGWTLPGVMTGRAARIMMHLHRVLPGRRAAVLGSGAEAEQLADDLGVAGIDVVARAESPGAIEAGGDGEVEWAVVNGRRHDVDTIVFALGAEPDYQLARQALCEIAYSERDGCHVPIRNRHLETTTSGVYVVGDAGGICSTAEAIAEGVVAAEAALAGSGLDEALQQLDRARSVSRSRDESRRQLPAAPDAIPDDVSVCRCEQISAAEIRTAVAEEAVTLNDVKRRTRAGMGVCQGIFCSRTIAGMIHTQTGTPLSDLVPMTARPPARLISLGELAATTE